MKTNKRFWTAKEEAYLKKQVSKNPNNLTKAFKNVAEKTGRTVNAVQFKWYTKVKKENFCFTLVSEEGVTRPNAKITKEDVVKVKEKTNKNFWQEFKRFIKRIAKM